MGLKWKVPMPKDRPAEGTAHFVLALKFQRGRQVEYYGTVPIDVACELLAKVAGDEFAETLKNMPSLRNP